MDNDETNYRTSIDHIINVINDVISALRNPGSNSYIVLERIIQNNVYPSNELTYHGVDNIGYTILILENYINVMTLY
jgi:hypothetical protein